MDLVGTSPRSQHDRTRREDRHLKFYELRDNLALVSDYLDVHVKDARVTLKGEVDHQYQSDAALDHATSLRGITGITNEIKVVERL
jgi:BON domain